MRRRNLLRTLMATPLAGWIRPWVPPSFGRATTDGANAADSYIAEFGSAPAVSNNFAISTR